MGAYEEIKLSLHTVHVEKLPPKKVKSGARKL